MQQGAEGDGDAGELGQGGDPGEFHQPRIAPRRPDQRHHRLQGGHQEGQHQGEMAEFDDHGDALGCCCCLALALLSIGPPLAARLQGLGDFRGHVFLVMLGQDLIRLEAAVGLQAAFHHHALALAEEVGQHALIGDGQRFLQIGHAEAGGHAIAILDHAALLHKPAEPHIPAHGRGLRHQIGGAVEEDDAAAQAVEDEAGGDGEHRHADDHEEQAPALAGHLLTAFRRRCRRASSSASAASRRRSVRSVRTTWPIITTAATASAGQT